MESAASVPQGLDVDKSMVVAFPHGGQGRSSLWIFLGFVTVLTLSVLPVLSHAFISTGDYYNHLARVAVLARFPTDPHLADLWHPNWIFLPNLAIDGIGLALLPWFSLATTGRIIIILTVAMPLAGAMLLSRVAHGRWTAVSLLAGLLLMNRMLLAGVFNYILGIGLVLLTLAAWLALRDRTGPRLLVLALMATCILITHLIAFAVLFVAIGAVELVTSIRQRSIKRAATTCIGVVAAASPSLLLLLAAPHQAGGSVIVFRDFIDRITAFAVPLTYAPTMEAVGLLAIGSGLVVFWLSGQLRIDWRLAVAAIVLGLIQLGMPGQIGDGTGADHRLPFPILLLALCSVDIRPRRMAHLLGFMACAGLLLAGRVVMYDRQWTRDGAIYAEVVHALDALPEGAKVATAYSPDALVSVSAPLTLFFLPAWVVVPKGGFTQTLWTKPAQHPLVMQAAFRRLADATRPEALWSEFVAQGDQAAAAGSLPAGETALKSYDYIAFLDPAPFTVRPDKRLVLTVKTVGIQIYRVGADATAR